MSHEGTWTSRDREFFLRGLEIAVDECNHEAELADLVYPDDPIKQQAYINGCLNCKCMIEDQIAIYSHKI